MALHTAIYTILSGDSGVTNLVSTRIYPNEAPQGTNNPCVLFSITDNDPVRTKDGAAPLEEHYLEIDIFVDYDVDDGYTIANAIKTALDQYSGTVDGEVIDHVRHEGTEVQGFNPDRENEQVVSIAFRMRTK